MPNQTYALEWLIMARKNLETAQLLFDANHYTDIIAVEVHQSIEKSMKAVLAYHGVKNLCYSPSPRLINKKHRIKTRCRLNKIYTDWNRTLMNH